MKKKTAVAFLAVLTIIGSFITYYSANLLFSDVANYTYGWNGLYFFATIPAFAFSLELIAATILVVRYYIRPQYGKRTLLLYTNIIFYMSLVGFAGAMCAAVFSYGAINNPYPFRGYIIISMIIHSFIMSFTRSAHSMVRKRPDDAEKKTIKAGYVFYSIILSIIVFFAFDRLGALMWGVTYIQTRTLYMTWPLYVWLLTPSFLLLFIVLKAFDVFKSLTDQICYLSLFFVFNLVLGITVVITGMHNSLFISAISPAMAADRLATFPLDLILHFVLMVFFCLYFLIRCIVLKVKQ